MNNSRQLRECGFMLGPRFRSDSPSLHSTSATIRICFCCYCHFSCCGAYQLCVRNIIRTTNVSSTRAFLLIPRTVDFMSHPDYWMTCSYVMQKRSPPQIFITSAGICDRSIDWPQKNFRSRIENGLWQVSINKGNVSDRVASNITLN